MSELREKTPQIIQEFVNALSLYAGGGLKPECTFDAILIVVAFCLGRANVKIHDNYKKAISTFKIIIAPISALKSPCYRLIRDILARLSVMMESAVNQLKPGKSSINEDEEVVSDGLSEESDSEEIVSAVVNEKSDKEEFVSNCLQQDIHPDVDAFLNPGSIEGLE